MKLQKLLTLLDGMIFVMTMVAFGFGDDRFLGLALISTILFFAHSLRNWEEK